MPLLHLIRKQDYFFESLQLPKQYGILFRKLDVFYILMEKQEAKYLIAENQCRWTKIDCKKLNTLMMKKAQIV